MHSPGVVVPEELELPPPPLEELVVIPELLLPLEDPWPPPELPDDEPLPPLLEVALPPDPLAEDPDERPPPEDPAIEPLLPEDPDVDPPLPEDPDVDPPLPEDPDVAPPLPEDPDAELLNHPDPSDGDVLVEHPYAVGAAKRKYQTRRRGLIDAPAAVVVRAKRKPTGTSIPRHECARASESVMKNASPSSSASTHIERPIAA
jgi:hypothetical protein